MAWDTKEKSAKYHLKRYHKIKIKMLEYLGGKCVVCGTTEKLEIHHKNPEEKSFNLSVSWGKPWGGLVVELNKCEIRCHAHHKVIHEAEHGTISRYHGHRCRCGSCRKAWNDYCRPFWQEYKRKKKLEKTLKNGG